MEQLPQASASICRSCLLAEVGLADRWNHRHRCRLIPLLGDEPMKKKTPVMGTTEVPASRTIAQITQVLVEAGARAVSQQYDQGKPTGLQWVMVHNGIPGSYTIPARVDPVYQFLRKQRRGALYQADIDRLKAQAERVAWRQLLRWVEAQVALAQIGMVDLAEPFSPYLTDENGQTMWQYLSTTRFKALPAPESAK